jgi:mono/diheme cytochrome c family protein
MLSLLPRLGWIAFAASLLALILPPGARAQSDLERGRYLMSSIAACGNCHTPKFGPLKDSEFAGGFPINTPAFDAFASNITPDLDTGIGKWTDAQIATAIREC